MKIDEKLYPNVYEGFQYAEGVRGGVIDVPGTIKDMVTRFFKDIERTKEENPPFYLNISYTERFMRLTQRFSHVKGANWKSKNIQYEPWQKFGYTNLFVFFNSTTNKRRFRTACFWEPRGQGKTTRAAQLGLYLLALDREVGPDIYCASTKKDAARLVLDSARFMALKNPEYCKSTGVRVLAHCVTHPKSNGIIKAVSSQTSTNDGWNCSGIIADELHEWKRELYDLADSSLTKRNDSLFLTISTAGFNTEGIGHEVYAYSKKVLAGDVEDDTWFAMIYEADLKIDDWQDPAVWRKVNPNWGISVDPINFEAKAKKAAETPASKNNFLVKHLNVWTNSASPYFSQELWDKCADKSLCIEQFKGEKVALGLDLATKVDLCSKIYIFRRDGIYYLFDKSYLPEARIEDNKNVQYVRWIDEGWLTKMPGEVNNFEKIQLEIIDQDAINYRIINTHADPWSANDTIQRLMKARVPVAEMRLSTGNLSEPMKQLDALIRTQKIKHNGSPLLRWCLGNVVTKPDANDNVFPRKDHVNLKIDPIVATIMAIPIWLNEDSNTSVYETRGLRSV